MNALLPLFTLFARASVFLLGLIGFACIFLIVVGVSEPDARLGLYLDPAWMAVLTFPLGAGWLTGALIQELQHTSFAWALPRLRARLAAGFLGSGVVFSAVVVLLTAQMDPPPQNLPLLFVVAIGAWCLGGVFVDPLSQALSLITAGVGVSAIVFSARLAAFAERSPWLVCGISIVIAVAAVGRLFARSTFRQKPFRSQIPFPGSYALERNREKERDDHVKVARAGRRWHGRRFGTSTWRWVRAAIHETYGARGWKTVPRAIGRAWGIGALVLLNAWLDRGELPLGEAIGRTLYDALLCSPHHVPIGVKGGLFPLATLVIGTAVSLTALAKPVSLNRGLLHPLSRRMHACVHYRGGLVDLALFLGFGAPFLLAIGHLGGRLSGIETRFDFMPYFFRVLLISLIALPLAHALQRWLVDAGQRREANSLVAMIVGIAGFVVVVSVLTWISPRLFAAPLVELAALGTALVLSQLAYRFQLGAYYRTADLA